MVANFGGRGSTRRLERHKKCDKCKRKGVYYVGSTVTHGNPFSPAADTDVEHYYECPHCEQSFTVFA